MKNYSGSTRELSSKYGAKYNLITLVLAVSYVAIVVGFLNLVAPNFSMRTVQYSGTTEGTITSSYIQSSPVCCSMLPSTYDFDYSYQVEGQYYTGSYSTEYKRFKEGQRALVHYLPNNPSESRAEPALRDHFITYSLLGMIIAAALAGLFYLLTRAVYKYKKIAKVFFTLQVLSIGLFGFSISILAMVATPILFFVIVALVFGVVGLFYLDNAKAHKKANLKKQKITKV